MAAPSNLFAMIGPAPPPSCWPLGDVPATILDSIVDQLADDATIDPHRKDGADIYGKPCFFRHEPGRPVVSFTPELKNLSMVNSYFRHNVMARKIAHTVKLKSASHIAKCRKKIRMDTFRCIREIVFAPSALPNVEFNLWAAERNSFTGLCQNLESVRDEAGEVAYAQHLFPASVTNLLISIHSETDKRKLLPIHAPGLNVLQIRVDQLSLGEYPGSREAARFPKRIARLLKHVKGLDSLGLQLPGLPANFLQNSKSLAFPDPIPASLERLETLELEIPFCTLDDTRTQSIYWWGYLNWLIETPSKFTQLAITITWGPPLGRIDTRDILNSMGLSGVDYDESNGKICDKDYGADASLRTARFFVGLFHHLPELQTIHFRCFAVSPIDVKAAPVMYRYLVGIKCSTDLPKDPVTGKCKDVIRFDVLDSIIKDMHKRSQRPAVLPSLTISGPNGQVDVPPAIVAQAASAFGQMMANFMPVAVPATQPPQEDDWEDAE